MAGARLEWPVRPVALDAATAGALLASGGVPAWSSGGKLVAAVEPVARPAVPDDVPRGQMDRAVVRNALSLAFLPRARACYLSRPVRTPADKELRGRLRLELHLERGELVAARVQSSTLDRPEIEACLREAAFGLEVPRPMHRDAPTVAVLNLVFQPRSSPAGADAGALGREIDLLIGPTTLPTDPRSLLDAVPLPGVAPTPSTP
jgi:hypothetical protein